MTLVQFHFADNTLTVRSWGDYPSAAALSTISILGLGGEPSEVALCIGSHASTVFGMYSNGVLEVKDLEKHTEAGAWERDLTLTLASPKDTIGVVTQ